MSQDFLFESKRSHMVSIYKNAKFFHLVYKTGPDSLTIHNNVNAHAYLNFLCKVRMPCNMIYLFIYFGSGEFSPI
jgi:hypothetical protein